VREEAGEWQEAKRLAQRLVNIGRDAEKGPSNYAMATLARRCIATDGNRGQRVNRLGLTAEGEIVEDW
jgi:hypothetical protein